jgi:hypothetical protein
VNALIAWQVIDGGHVVLHDDRDFDHIARVVDLRVLEG